MLIKWIGTRFGERQSALIESELASIERAPPPCASRPMTDAGLPIALDTVDLARIQFAMTSIYHFLFVPLTLGLAPLVAVMQTLWHRTRNEQWLRLTRFFGHAAR